MKGTQMCVCKSLTKTKIYIYIPFDAKILIKCFIKSQRHIVDINNVCVCIYRLSLSISLSIYIYMYIYISKHV